MLNSSTFALSAHTASGAVQVQRDGTAGHEEGLHLALCPSALPVHSLPRCPRQRRHGGPAPLPGVSHQGQGMSAHMRPWED